MTGEHLLNAMGLLDDDLIQEAEEYRRSRRGGGPWLGYGAVRLGTVGGANNMSGGASAPAASAPAGGEPSASAPLSPEGGDSLPWGGQAGSAGDETELDRPSGEPLPQEPDASFTPRRGELRAGILCCPHLYHRWSHAVRLSLPV